MTSGAKRSSVSRVTAPAASGAKCSRAQGSDLCASHSADARSRQSAAFSAQGDAESWLGETWRDLAERGVSQVFLLEDDREVYGPMSLAAPE